ncbi:cytochrome P450 [Mycena floridula]|nr:cytochrome P450 [Mycena floridula]
MTTPIPQPPSIPFLGNVSYLDKEVPTRGFHKLAKQFGEIYQLNLVGRMVIFASSHALVNELSDDSRFRKSVGGALKETRTLLNDGIFTAFNDEPSWAVAHRLLVPAFGVMAVRDMFDDMHDVCNELIETWKRLGPKAVIDPTEGLTRLALETIGLCAMSYRFDSFYGDDQPALVGAVHDFLLECNNRANRPRIVQALMREANAKYQADIDLLRGTAHKIMAERRACPSDKDDLLNTMLKHKDSKTGECIPDESIVDNLLTFLISGHETTSSTMSFALYYLLKHPECMMRLQDEVDEVIGDQPAQHEDLNRMPYLTAFLRETMRLQPTAAIRVVYPLEDTIIAQGKYFLKGGSPVALQIWDSHRDVEVWGPDAEQFHPERMLDGKFEQLPPNAWQPFGAGRRRCLGRVFSWQQMCLALSTIVQKFDLCMVDPTYTLELKQTMTIKPRDFFVYAVCREKTK